MNGNLKELKKIYGICTVLLMIYQQSTNISEDSLSSGGHLRLNGTSLRSRCTLPEDMEDRYECTVWISTVVWCEGIQ